MDYRRLWRDLFGNQRCMIIDESVEDIVILSCWNCLVAFAVKHCFRCRTTEPAYAGDIGAIDIWLIY